jgi:hypothetical protein
MKNRLQDYFTRAAVLKPASFSQQYKTGTMSIVSTSIVIPPKDGMAIGIIISAPRPVAVNTGISARMVVAVVIRHALILRLPASTVASRISTIVLGLRLRNDCSK